MKNLKLFESNLKKKQKQGNMKSKYSSDINYWIQKLQTGVPSEKVEAAEVLGEIGDGRAIAPLMEALMKNKGNSFDSFLNYNIMGAIQRITRPKR